MVGSGIPVSWVRRWLRELSQWMMVQPAILSRGVNPLSVRQESSFA